jgi:hypothetical protein
MNATLTTSSVQGDPTGTPFDIDDLELSSHRANQQFAGLYAIFDSNGNFPTIGVEETIRVTLSGTAMSIRATVYFLQDTASSSQVNSTATSSSASGSVSLSLSTSSANALDLGVCGTYSADVNGGGDDTQISYFDGDAGDASVYVWTEDGVDSSNTVEPGSATVAWAGCAASIEGTAASSTDELSADDVESDSEVSAPSLGQVHALLADDVESASEVSTPSAAEGEHSLTADDVESASEVSAPSLGQVHALTADDVESDSEVSAPTLSDASVYDTFGGSGSLDSDLWTTYDESISTDNLEVTQSGGRYNADWKGDDTPQETLWFNSVEGQMHYISFNGDSQVIFRNIGLHSGIDDDEYQFCGPMVHKSVGNFMWSGVGNRPSNRRTIEYKVKHTGTENSSQNDIGNNALAGYKADLRCTVTSGVATIAYSEPGANSWTDLDHGSLSGGKVSMSGEYKVGLVAYGFDEFATPFVGTCDQVEIVSGTVLGTDDLTADDVESASEVSAPSLGQVHAITADDVESASEVTTPDVGQVHALTADDSESSSEVSAPSIGQVHALTSTDVESASEVSTPTASESSEGEDSLLADNVESASEVSTPDIGQVHDLTADDVESSTEVSAPALSEADYVLTADVFESASEVSAPALAEVHVLYPNGVESASNVSTGTLAQVHVLYADDVEIASEVTAPRLGDPSLEPSAVGVSISRRDRLIRVGRRARRA